MALSPASITEIPVIVPLFHFATKTSMPIGTSQISKQLLRWISGFAGF
jgi:hypothetical protein